MSLTIVSEAAQRTQKRHRLSDRLSGALRCKVHVVEGRVGVPFDALKSSGISITEVLRPKHGYVLTGSPGALENVERRMSKLLSEETTMLEFDDQALILWFDYRG